mgnify:CR=1 FL=1
MEHLGRLLRCIYRDPVWFWLAHLGRSFEEVYNLHQGKPSVISKASTCIDFKQLGIPGAVTYNMSTLFTKVAILLFYLRLSTDFRFRCVTYAVMFVAVGYSLAGGFAFLYLCRPLPKYWDFSIPGKCSNFGAAFLAGAALNVATDVALLLLPLWLLHPLKLPLRQKIGVTLILMTGSL